MLIYATKRLISSGSRSKKLLIRAVGGDLSSHKKLGKHEALGARISWPDGGRNIHKSKKHPIGLIPSENMAVLESLDPVWVPEEYLPILVLLIRKELYHERSGVGIPPEIEAWFKLEIRGKYIALLRSRKKVFDPEDSRLENLNRQLEKIDLGRRRDLNHGDAPVEEVEEVTSKYARGVTASKEEKGEPLPNQSPTGRSAAFEAFLKSNKG